MSKRNVSVQTQFGPVAVELVSCDGPECGVSGQSQFMVGWLKLAPQGNEAPVMGGLSDPMDFCGLPCLYKAVSMMTGN